LTLFEYTIPAFFRNHTAENTNIEIANAVGNISKRLSALLKANPLEVNLNPSNVGDNIKLGMNPSLEMMRVAAILMASITGKKDLVNIEISSTSGFSWIP
jgi:hypothetical protein